MLTCPPETSLRMVARIMVQHRTHCVVVTPGRGGGEGDDRAWGVVTDLDVVDAALGNLDERTAGSAVSPVVTVGPGASLEHAVELMSANRASHLLVLNLAEWPVGVLSTLDVAAFVGGVPARTS